jgi:hypothetical protein
MSDSGLQREFRKGHESAKIRNRWHGIGKGLLMAAGLVVAWILPIAWYWQIAMYIAGMLIVGLIIQAFAMVREHMRR